MSMVTYLQRAMEDAHVVELRHQHGGRWISGTFSKIDPLLDTVAALRESGNIYTTLNRPAEFTATNRMGARALKDDDIGVICRIPFDFDPDRPTDTPSTDVELEAACQARLDLVRLLSGHGWPMPAMAISGNGAHALYRARIKATPEWRKAVAILYAGLRDRLHEPLLEYGVKFDTTVRNPARIWRLYGTENRKGTATADRPHRTATVRLPARAWQPVPVDVLKRTIAALRPDVVREPVRRNSFAGCVERPEGTGDYKTLNVISWFQAHNAYRRPLSEGRHAVECPWIGEHTTTSTSGTDSVIWERGDSGWPTFHCSHYHCEDRTLVDVMRLWADADAFCAKEYSHG